MSKGKKPNTVSKNQARKKSEQKLQEKRKKEKQVSKQLAKNAKAAKRDSDRKLVQEFQRKAVKSGKAPPTMPKALQPKPQKVNNKLSKEDKEFLQEYGQYANIVQGIDANKLASSQPKGKKKRLQAEKEASYEKKPRNFEDQSSRSSLPTIGNDGKVVSAKPNHFERPKLVKESTHSHSDDDSSEVDDEVGEPSGAQDEDWSDVDDGSDSIDAQKEDSDDESDDDGDDDSEDDETSHQPAKPKPGPMNKVAGQDDEKTPRHLRDLQEQIAQLSASYREDMPLAKKRVYVGIRKHQLADISTIVLENPDMNIRVLKNMDQFCRDRNISVRKLSYLTFFAVFKDILPDYHIRELSAEELKVKVSKDVRQLRDFEAAVLKYYQMYLKLLEKMLKKSSVVSEKVVLVKCLGELLHTKPAFNFSQNIMDLLIPYMNSKISELADFSCNLIAEILDEDIIMDVSLDVIKVISKVVKSKNYQVRPQMLDVLLKLRLHEDLDEEDVKSLHPYAAQSSKKQQHVSKKMKKKMRIEKQLEKDMQEAEAEVNRTERKKKQMEIMKMVFLIYFRILKSGQNSPSLPAVLEGLAKFSHLISMDYLSDLLAYLKVILDLSLPRNTILKCIMTTFQLMSGQGNSLVFDLKDFYIAIYGIIPDLIDPEVCRQEGALYISTLKTVLLERKLVSAEMLSSFIKRIGALSMHTPLDISMALLSVVKEIMLKHPKVIRLLEYEDNEQYDFHKDDPSLARGLSSACWEFCELQKHYHPHLSKIAKKMTTPQSLPTVFSNISSDELLGMYSTNQGLFNPDLTIPGDTPLQMKYDKNKKNGDARHLYLQRASASLIMQKESAANGDTKAKVEAPDFASIFEEIVSNAPVWTLPVPIISRRIKNALDSFKKSGRPSAKPVRSKSSK